MATPRPLPHLAGVGVTAPPGGRVGGGAWRGGGGAPGAGRRRHGGSGAGTAGPGTAGKRGQRHPGPGPRLPLLLLLGGLASLAGAQVTSENKEVPEHEPVEIPCAAFRSGSSPRIEWKFQKASSLVLIYYGGELTEPYRERVQFSRTSIRFQSVTREDSGRYICEVVGDSSHIAKSEVNLIVQVPPGKPQAHVPSSVTVGARAVLRCSEAQGSPPPTFRWYKDGTELPQDPKSSPAFRNSSYSLDPGTGELVFEPVGGWDTGDYHCEASNSVGTPQKSDVFRMEASEVNVGGIVAAVVLLLLVLALAGFGVWFAYSRGYFTKKTDAGGKKVIYSQPSRRSEGEFKQTSSFLV
ncbi:junctional adhesion molecule A [Chamaea fasciata]|uniref:junctional adhesion molecule A n=1 Tax=Chamaea fasciata TaxID=190680 RepID=UPI00336A2943